MSLSRAEEAFVSQLMAQQNADAGTTAPPAAPATPAANVLYTESLLYAWAAVTLTAGTPSIADQYNVSGIADNGVGDYTLTFATPFASTNYIASGMVMSAGTSPLTSFFLTGHTLATGSFRYILREHDNAADDENHVVMLTGRQ